jgi:hypothetical protein
LGKMDELSVAVREAARTPSLRRSNSVRSSLTDDDNHGGES